MDLIRKSDLENLMGVQKNWCVSIYMPARKAGREKRQNPILFKNSMKEAEEQLKEAGVSNDESRNLLEPAHQLVRADYFWQFQSDGLAVFITPGLFLTYRLPERFEKLVVVAKRFHLKPLLPLLSSGGHFFVLALSQKEVRLLKATQYSMSVVHLDKVPKSMADALKYDEPETQLQFPARTKHGAGTRAAIFHGHGSGLDERKDDLLHYFQKVDRGLQDILAGERAPLVLASVEYYWPIFAEASSYPHLVDGGIKGNPEEADEDELHKQAWDLVRPVFAREQREGLEAYNEFKAQGRTSTDLKVVVPAAHLGRVATLFVALGIQKWGVYLPEKAEIIMEEKAGANNLDLFDLAVAQTLSNGGNVFALSREEMPSQASIAAILRY